MCAHVTILKSSFRDLDTTTQKLSLHSLPKPYTERGHKYSKSKDLQSIRPK